MLLITNLVSWERPLTLWDIRTDAEPRELGKVSSSEKKSEDELVMTDEADVEGLVLWY